ncbi:MAG TPA: serpin family protein [Thermoleophilia bacterium]|nr:serpin family protein [Thermoleophilia bacterium]
MAGRLGSRRGCVRLGQGGQVIRAVLPATILILTAALALSAGLAGCGTATSQEVTESGFLVSTEDRDFSPVVAQDVTQTLVAGNNIFGLELFREIRTDSDNLICSPYGLSTVLAMTIAGATGETEHEMAKVLHFDLAKAQLHDAFNGLDQALSVSGEFKIANALWGSDMYSYNQSFVDLLTRDYGAGLGILDFTRTVEARAVINGWVSKETNGRIPELVGPDDFKVGTEPVLMLADAVYFKADWEHQFPKGGKRDLPFHLLNGQMLDVPMMNQEEFFPNGKGDDFQAVELPYAGGRYSMVLVLPAEGTFEDFASSVTDAKLGEILASLEQNQIEVLMPRFQFSSTPKVEDALKTLGMTKMFENRGDFLGMLDTSGPIPEGLWVGGVRQKAFIAVGELGTEAAAASAVTMVGGVGPPEEHNEILLNRPFLYLIRDRDSGQIVFVGQVVDPSQTAE